MLREAKPGDYITHNAPPAVLSEIWMCCATAGEQLVKLWQTTTTHLFIFKFKVFGLSWHLGRLEWHHLRRHTSDVTRFDRKLDHRNLLIMSNQKARWGEQRGAGRDPTLREQKTGRYTWKTLNAWGDIIQNTEPERIFVHNMQFLCKYSETIMKYRYFQWWSDFMVFMDGMKSIIYSSTDLKYNFEELTSYFTDFN